MASAAAADEKINTLLKEADKLVERDDEDDVNKFDIEDDEEEEGDIRFEMYSPEDDLEHIRVVPQADKQAVTVRHDFADKGLLGGMADYLSKKKQDFNGFLEKLDKME